MSLRIVILGLSITSSWGNGHATTYRGLVRALTRRGHEVTFLERDVPWYADNRDLPHPPFGQTSLYRDLDTLFNHYELPIREADLVIVGSYVPDGIAVGEWVQRTAAGITAFYDIDTPVTLAGLQRGECSYLSRDLIPRYDLYLSFTGGPTLDHLCAEYGARRARALYCSVDPEIYYPQPCEVRWLLGYLGTYAADRQPALEQMLLQPARDMPEAHFVVAGPSYPATVTWPANVLRIDHLAPQAHRSFYNEQAFTLNVTRQDMVRAGYSPSVRLFEAAACATPIISDAWAGLESVLDIGREVLVARSAHDVLALLCQMSVRERTALGQRARERILASHTAEHRVVELERYVREVSQSQRTSISTLARQDRYTGSASHAKRTIRT